MKDKLLKIINHYGVMKQLKYFQSEIFELNEAIIKMQNKKWDLEGKSSQIVEPTLHNYRLHVVEEIADILVMLHQFIEYYKIQDSDIYMIMEQKIDRQLKRIEEEKNE